jgi:hypothetical protein
MTIGFRIEGRLAGPWVAELDRVWRETIPSLGGRTVRLDLCDLMYTDEAGKETLRGMVSATGAEMIASSAWSQYLAEELRDGKHRNGIREAEDGNNARSGDDMQGQQ